MKNLLLPLLACSILATNSAAQVFDQSPSPTPPSSPAAAPAGQPSGGGNNNNTNNQGDIFGVPMPAIDPSSEVATWNGQAWNVNDNRIVSARFEAYLNQPENNSELDQEYHETLREILQLLSPLNRDNEKLRKAISLLPRAASFRQDANLSDMLLNAVFRAYLVKRQDSEIDATVRDLEREMKNIEYRADLKARDTNLGASRKVGSDATNSETKADGRGVNSMEYENLKRRMEEIHTHRKTSDARRQLSEIQAKTEFHILIAQLFLQRRFEHTVIACRFYDQIFNDGDGTLRIEKNSDVGRIFGEGLGGNPTISSIDSMANSIINDVGDHVQSFIYLVERDELASAFKRLQEAFVVGEYLPEVRTLPREQKRKVLEFARKQFALLGALQTKDLTTAQRLIDELKAIANDYDGTKEQAYVSTHIQVSNMHLARAQVLSSQGNVDEASQEIQKAMEIWPTNPKIQEDLAPQFARQVEMAEVTESFDRLISERNYRAIYRDKEKFGVALAAQDDEQRAASLRTIVENLIRIDTTIGQSREMETSSMPGATFAAWELIQNMVEQYPDDSELRIRAEELSRRASEFVSALEKAKELENRGQHGSAYAYYLKARNIYPDSKKVEKHITTMLDRVLPSDADQFSDRSPANSTFDPVSTPTPNPSGSNTTSHDPFDN